MSLQLSVFILCLSFLLVALAAIPFLLQLWRTMKTLETTLQTLNRTLPGLLENLEAITLNLRHVTRTVDVQMERLALAVDRASFGLGVLWNLKSVLLTGSRMPGQGRGDVVGDRCRDDQLARVHLALKAPVRHAEVSQIVQRDRAPLAPR